MSNEQDDAMVAELNALRINNMELRGELAMLVGYMECCRLVNTDRYLSGLVDRLNDAAKLMHLTGKYRENGSWIERVV